MSPDVAFEIWRDELGYGPNDRVHWATKARRTKEFRVQAYLQSSMHRQAKECTQHATLRYTVTWAKGKRRLNDPDNLIAQLKPCTDGIKDGRLIRDDSPEWLTLLPVEQIKGAATMVNIKVEIEWSR